MKFIIVAYFLKNKSLYLPKTLFLLNVDKLTVKFNERVLILNGWINATFKQRGQVTFHIISSSLKLKYLIFNSLK